MIVFGLLARKRCGQKSPASQNGEICQLVRVMVDNEGCISFQSKQT